MNTNSTATAGKTRAEQAAFVAWANRSMPKIREDKEVMECAECSDTGGLMAALWAAHILNRYAGARGYTLAVGRPVKADGVILALHSSGKTVNMRFVKGSHFSFTWRALAMALAL